MLTCCREGRCARQGRSFDYQARLPHCYIVQLSSLGLISLHWLLMNWTWCRKCGSQGPDVLLSYCSLSMWEDCTISAEPLHEKKHRLHSKPLTDIWSPKNVCNRLVERLLSASGLQRAAEHHLGDHSSSCGSCRSMVRSMSMHSFHFY